VGELVLGPMERAVGQRRADHEFNHSK
jgi:hypothetical protein